MQTNSVEKNFLFILLAASIIFTLVMFYPFISVIILASAFAVILTPVYKWIHGNVTRGVSWLASLLTIFIFLIVLCVPLFFMGSVVFNQAQNAYNNLVQNGNTSTFIDRINTSVNNVMPDGLVFDTQGRVKDLISFLSNNITNFFTYTFDSAIKFVLMILTLFYLLKDGHIWKKILIRVSPLSEKNIEEILSELSSTVNRTIKGSFIIAIVQGIFATIGFIMFGVPNPALWGVVAGLTSFVPTVGTSLVSIPAMIYLYINGMNAQVVGLLVWWLFLVGMIDNIIGPYVISKNTEIPSLFILFSILGGISLMGPIGLLIGPLALSFLYVLVSIYRKETSN